MTARCSEKKELIGVIGSGEDDKDLFELSRQIGGLIARAGMNVVNGGLFGVMEGSALGCSEAGGLTIGLLPGLRAVNANPYIDITIPTGMGEMRNALIIRASAGLIAIGGGYGTLSEIALAHKSGKPVVGLRTWDVSDKTVKVQTPEQAVTAILKEIGK